MKTDSSNGIIAIWTITIEGAVLVRFMLELSMTNHYRSKKETAVIIVDSRQESNLFKSKKGTISIDQTSVTNGESFFRSKNKFRHFLFCISVR